MSGAEIEAAMPDLCASYQFAVIEQLRRRCDWFAKRKPYKSLGISGGVSNNSVFAGVFEKLARSRNAKFLIADRQHRGDNAAMIASEGLNQYMAGNFSPLDINAAAAIPLK